MACAISGWKYNISPTTKTGARAIKKNVDRKVARFITECEDEFENHGMSKSEVNGIITNVMRESANLLLNAENSNEEDLGAAYRKQKRR